MKKVIFCLISALLATFNAHAEEPKYKKVESFSYDWLKNGKAANFLVEIPEGWDDPGDFTRVTIELHDGSKPFVLDKLTGDVLPKSLAESSDPKSPSKYLAFIPTSESKNDKSPDLLFIYNYAFASSPGELDVIWLNSEKNKPTVIFKKNYDVESIGFEKSKHDQRMLIYGRFSYSQCIDRKSVICTYDPNTILFLNKKATIPNVEIDIKASKAFNKANNYPWAGPDGSEQIYVNKKNHKAITQDEASKLASSKPKD